MTAREMIRYLEAFDPDNEVVMIAVNSKARERYKGSLMAVTDMGQPVLVIDVTGKEDFEEEDGSE